MRWVRRWRGGGDKERTEGGTKEAGEDHALDGDGRLPDLARARVNLAVREGRGPDGKCRATREHH
ncbi:hypothetical protein B1218_37840 [Pseudomonas ogarae]|nr:hypothetical protein B1218_37840 [Pseudomonas ogarae]